MRSSLEQRVEDLENAGSGVTTFLALTDTPATYTGQSLKVARVNAGETALEFVTLAGGGDLLAANNLSDVANVSTARTNLGLNTTANQTDSTDKRFMTDAQETKLDGLTQYTDELAQDAVGGMAANSTFINLNYLDGAPSLTPALSATGTPSSSTFLRGDNTWSAPDDPYGWTIIVKSANQDVTNSATFTNDTDLQFSVVAGGHYMIEMNVCYSGNNTTADYKFELRLTAGIFKGQGNFLAYSTTGVITNASLAANSAINTNGPALGVNTADIDSLQFLTIYFNFSASVNATFNYRFAQNTATAATTSRTWKGSILKYKRID
jgi:hypothetical protein